MSESSKSSNAVRKMSKERSNLIAYEIDPGDSDISIGCLVRAHPIRASSKEHVTVERCDQLNGNPVIGWAEELLGNIVAFKFHKGVVTKTQDQMQVLLPFLHTRNNPCKVPTIKVQHVGCQDWLELESMEANVELYKEFRFLETSLSCSDDCKMAVVARLRRETLTASVPHALKVNSSVDPRLTFTFKQALLKKPLTFELEYLPVDLMAIQELKRRQPDEMKCLLGCTGIVTLKDLNIYISITLPIHPPPLANKVKRPSTGMDHYPSQPIATGGESKTRPKTANQGVSFFNFLGHCREDEIEDRLVLMIFQDPGDGNHGSWSISRMVNFSESRKKDLVTIDLERPIPSRFIVLRYKPDVDDGVLLKMAENVALSMMFKTVHFVLRQHEEKPEMVIVQIVGPVKLDRILRKMTDDGYTYGPPISSPILLREGQEVELKFRTNIGGIKADDKSAAVAGNKESFREEENVSDKSQLPRFSVNNRIFDLYPQMDTTFDRRNILDYQQSVIRMVFNSHLRSQIHLRMFVLDKYSQKALDCYRGFVQTFVKNEIATSESLWTKVAKESKIAFGETQPPSASLSSSSSSNLLDRLRKVIHEKFHILPEDELFDSEENQTEAARESTEKNPFNKRISSAAILSMAPTVKQFAFLEKKKLYENMKLLCELLVELPKPLDESKFTVKRTPFIIRPDGIIDHALLENLSQQIGKEWVQLAEQLNVRRIRIDAIFRDCSNQKAALDVLMSWIKRMPRCANKVEILAKALHACGRRDLSRFLLEKNAELKRRLPVFSKEAVLARSIKTIGRYSYLIYDWRLLCRRLGLSDDFIDSVQSKISSILSQSKYPDARERCHRILTKWQENGIDDSGGMAALTSLAAMLRDVKCYQLADILEREYEN